MNLKEDIANAVKVLREGGIILYPTDTIWGLGCDATNRAAVEKVFNIKGRDNRKSLLVLVDGEAMLERYVREVPQMASEIISVSDSPITIIYPGAKNLAEGVAAEDGSVGIRITSDPFCLELIRGLRKPVVSTSANASGEPAPVNFAAIPEAVIKSADYVVSHKRDDRKTGRPSPVIKIEINGEIKIIRK